MKNFYSGAITTGSGTLCYTVPSGYETILKDIHIANTTSSTVTCIIHLVASGGSVATATQFLPTVSISANSVLQWTGSQLLNAGSFIQAIGSVAGINVFLTGDENRA